MTISVDVGRFAAKISKLNEKVKAHAANIEQVIGLKVAMLMVEMAHEDPREAIQIALIAGECWEVNADACVVSRETSAALRDLKAVGVAMQ